MRYGHSRTAGLSMVGRYTLHHTLSTQLTVATRTFPTALEPALSTTRTTLRFSSVTQSICSFIDEMQFGTVNDPSPAKSLVQARYKSLLLTGIPNPESLQHRLPQIVPTRPDNRKLLGTKPGNHGTTAIGACDTILRNHLGTL